MSTPGHNSAAYGQELLDEFDFRAFFDFVCSSHASMAEKMLTLIHARRAGPHGEPGTISRAEAMKLASCSSATFQRAIPIVRIFFEIEQKRGKPTTYKPDRAITEDQIEAAITTIRAGGMYQRDTSKTIDTSKSITQSDASNSSIDQNDTSNRSIGINQADTYQQKENPPDPLKKKTTSDPDGSGAEAPKRTLRELVWSEGLSWCEERSMTDPVRLRTRFGRWVKDYGEAIVLNAIYEAQKAEPIEPLSYIEAVLKNGGKPKRMNGWQDEERQQTDKYLAACEV